MYKDVMSIVKMILFSPEKLKLRNVSSAWLLRILAIVYASNAWYAVVRVVPSNLSHCDQFVNQLSRRYIIHPTLFIQSLLKTHD